MLSKKLPALIILVFFTAFLSSAQGIQPAPANKAVVYIVRTSVYGIGINFSFYDSTRFLGKFNGTNYLRYECEPGSHLLWARSENRDFVEADLEAGKTYFLEVVPQMGAVKAGVKMYPVIPTDEKKMAKVLKLLNKKSPALIVDDLLVPEPENAHDIMVRGLEKYNEEKAKGKTMTRLEKTMHYTRE